jgi:hypothetical protein
MRYFRLSQRCRLSWGLLGYGAPSTFKMKLHCNRFISIYNKIIFWSHISNCFIIDVMLLCRASSSLSATSRLVPSANKTNFIPWMFNGRSLIYNKYRRGPKIEPYNTPFNISLSADKYLFCVKLLRSIWVITTNCGR